MIFMLQAVRLSQRVYNAITRYHNVYHVTDGDGVL